MKLLCEVTITEAKTFEGSDFDWLSRGGNDNLLFTFENRKRMRVFAIKNKNGLQNNNKQAASRAHEAQSASLAEPRQCTSSSWNRDESLLALVVDRRQIYLWEVHRNTFVQFKPKYLIQEQQFAPADEAPAGGRRRASGKYIDHIAWSKTSNKLAICLSDAQILLCNVATDAERSYVSSWERLVGNSEGLLKQINAIYVSEHADLFVCSSTANELLVMSFDGANLLYCLGEGEASRMHKIKFSPLIREYDSRLGAYSEHRLWLAYQRNLDSSIFLRKISLKCTSSQAQEDVGSLKLAVPLEDPNQLDGSVGSGRSLVDFHWLNPARLLCCLSGGSVQLLSISDTSRSLLALSGDSCPAMSISVAKREVLHLRPKSVDEESAQMRHKDDTLKAFELVQNSRQSEDPDCRQCFAFAAISSYRLHCYEIYESREATVESGEEFPLEHLDDMDLSGALGKVNLKLERLKWSQDCSMLALQLSSGHLLIYQTQQLHDHMVASHRAKTAYLSAPNEITLLNYEVNHDLSKLPADDVETFHGGRNSTSSSRAGTPTGGNAIILSLPFKPSLLAIGRRHLAVALNNRVRFYTIETILRLNNQIASDNQRLAEKQHDEYAEQEYLTLVVGIGLSSRFVATMLDDGRLKLHSLNQLEHDTRRLEESRSVEEPSGSTDQLTDGLVDDERFFPDPGHTTHRITAFALTEELLVYCTSDCHIYVFSLKHWQTVQTHDHSVSFKTPVHKLKPNDRGNKFVCLLDSKRWQQAIATSAPSKLVQARANVYLYDLFANKMFDLDCNQSHLANLLPEKLIASLHSQLPPELSSSIVMPKSDRRAPSLSNIRDVIWDTDGRSLLFIENKSIHVLAILEHTLDQEEPLNIYADSAKKPAAHSTLYVSEGIVSYQTSLGRVINSILETHDDELKLTRLEHKIKLINDQCATITGPESTSARLLDGHLKVVLLKLEYLRSILPIYSLPKCRDICEHLMDEQAFSFRAESVSDSSAKSWIERAGQLIWRQLAGWSIFTLNLNFAREIFHQNGLHDEATVLDDLFESMKATGLNSRSAINEKLFQLLERL